ncbi:hypothetical protein [Kordiimonas sp. SCSIO 12610]|uniref:hypothetical protein n=1 Tax=Kordiimonas sp. SCSIO 12610 TaxID=2829597 RepID=UPI002109F42A|nr:hypothetical protein [Kordiimonas sp. SCSIO 12610]UTW56718.1 hypothetical protein KFF44_07475 [Kordiimonas sp. SCSIO 12610]
MNVCFKFAALLSISALAACGSDDSKSTEDMAKEGVAASEAADDASSNAETKAPDLIDEAKVAVENIADKASEAASDLTNAIPTLDTSSLDSFKSSLSDMQKLLTPEQQGALTNAMAMLAKEAVSDSGESGGSNASGLLDKAKDIAGGKSAEDIVYESMGDMMNGMSFEDILNFAEMGSE